MKKLSSIFLSALILCVPVSAFAKENQGKKPIDYVALGDSLAAGVTPFGGIDKGYPDFLLDDLTQSNRIKDFENFGHSGYTATQLENDLLTNKEVQKEIKHADLITLDIGANDLIYTMKNEPQNAGAMLKNLSVNIPEIMGTIKELNPRADVYVMGYYNPFKYFPAEQKLLVDPVLAQLNLILEQSVNLYGYEYVPTEKVIEQNYNLYLPNPADVHLSLAGYKAIGDTFYEEILK